MIAGLSVRCFGKALVEGRFQDGLLRPRSGAEGRFIYLNQVVESLGPIVAAHFGKDFSLLPAPDVFIGRIASDSAVARKRRK